MLTPESGAGRPAPCQRCKGTRTVVILVKGAAKRVPCPSCKGPVPSGGYLTK